MEISSPSRQWRASVVGTQPMLQNPMSMAVLSPPKPWADPAPPYPPSASRAGDEPSGRTLRPSERQLLALLGAHEVLTSGQLARLAGLPERTVQHRLGLLYRAGLVNRVRPPREVGTSPYHCWLTALGAIAVEVEEPTSWSEDPAGVVATAVLSELRLSVRDHGEQAGLSLIGWRRLPAGLPYRDPRGAAPRALPVEGELTSVGGAPGDSALDDERHRSRRGAAGAEEAAAPASATRPDRPEDRPGRAGEGEEGYSIPAQREAPARRIRDAGWDLVDEYAERGESARSAECPQLQAMLARIATERDVNAVVVHKIDRLSRNMEDHVAIRALLRRRGVALVSVTENVLETTPRRLVEGIHALMAEFYSANLAAEIKRAWCKRPSSAASPTAPRSATRASRRSSADARWPASCPTPTGLRSSRSPSSTTPAALDPPAPGRRTRSPGPHQPRPAGPAGQGDHLAGARQDPRQPGPYRHLGWRRPRPPPAAHHPRDLPPGPRAARGPFCAWHPGAQAPPLPEGRPVLRGVRKAPVDTALQGPVHLLVLPRPEERPRRHLPGTLRRRRRSRSPSRTAHTAIELPATWAERLREELDAEVIERQRADAAPGAAHPPSRQGQRPHPPPAQRRGLHPPRRPRRPALPRGAPSALRRHLRRPRVRIPNTRADDGIRTRDPHLGKVMLYQLSHVRSGLPG